MSAPSPSPSMPPPNLKRPRVSASTAPGQPGQAQNASGAGPSAPAARGNKRRKPEGSVGPDVDKRNAAVATPGKEDWVEGEVRTKVDFNELPVETLYKYLEHHDLLPRWHVSPWSEEPCTPPNQLYTLPPAAPLVPNPTQPPSPSSSGAAPPTESTPALPPGQGDVHMSDPLSNGAATGVNGAPESLAAMNGVPALPQLPPLTEAGQIDSPAAAVAPNGNSANGNGNGPSTAPQDVLAGPVSASATEPDSISVQKADGEDGELGDGEQGADFEPPTTRSKTLPTRVPVLPEPEIKRGVITLSDVYAAREALAEKANAHWMKGLGGGQNKEGETIVNFLYKMKVGHGRLLRIYNPTPSTFPW